MFDWKTVASSLVSLALLLLLELGLIELAPECTVEICRKSMKLRSETLTLMLTMTVYYTQNFCFHRNLLHSDRFKDLYFEEGSFLSFHEGNYSLIGA